MRKTVALRTTIKITVFLVLTAALALSQAQDAMLILNPAQTTVSFVLGDVLHTVHGTFQVIGGQVHYAPASGAVSGEIVIDAASGNSGNDSRDRKMHREVLESARYPKITFRPDRFEGKLSPGNTSRLQVHGMFNIHGSEHEITVPVSLEPAQDHWNLTAHFVVPYVKWGLKDPSTFVLRVAKVVDIDIHASVASPSVTQP